VARQVECLIPSKKMIVKMLTHVHKVVNTCWCWHICEGSGVCVVERGLGSALFVEVKRLFSTTPEVEKKWRRTKVTVVTGR
jgi:hypothetical protein